MRRGGGGDREWGGEWEGEGVERERGWGREGKGRRAGEGRMEEDGRLMEDGERGERRETEDGGGGRGEGEIIGQTICSMGARVEGHSLVSTVIVMSCILHITY